MTDIKSFFFPFSALKNITIAMAMLRLFALIKKKTIHFIYQ